MNESITDETSRTTYEYFVSDLFKYINISLKRSNVKRNSNQNSAHFIHFISCTSQLIY